MIHSVMAPTFEGPLGLLLELAEKGKVELTAISVSDITAGYLARVRAMSGLEPEELSDFLGLGSRLLYIKSLSLLPASDTLEQRQELSRLNNELQEYRRYQAVARTLSARLGEPIWHRPTIERLGTGDLPMPNINLAVLREAFGRALRKATPAITLGTIEDTASQEDVIAGLRSRLSNGPITLSDMLADSHDRYEIIMLFLAVLELLKGGQAIVTQDSQFASITIKAFRA